ncbi:pyruvate kinase [Gracilinema caldarium]|uniref:Pyruvate kinase n=1 Tax=Gracilinema caldarium (strain ATCC 51460 / DSM 7334 / H1) TaxID=744872 RepID=F8EYY4_GRAC1|nr:pyruvate kinase [Gracilinema caldarium]AEJ18930.1 pyruvate kinase [Gracilinema caldarium DSM 7334]
MAFERNTRIICTMGPAVRSVDMIRSLIRRGMNMARFNFSHGDHEYHGEGIHMVREAARLEGVPIALILDTKGPEIRTGQIQDGGTITLQNGQFIEVIAEVEAKNRYGDQGLFTTPDRLTVSYADLAQDVKPGARILIADGLFSLDVVQVDGPSIRCRVTNGGVLGSRKNVNVIGVRTRLPALSEQDKADISFGVEQGMDFIAASFVRKAADVTTIHKYLATLNSDIPVIAKIEDEEGLENIEEIIRVSAGIMVARGDLGVQIPTERVPLEQKRIIRLCNHAGKPVITATQMLESMIKNPRPTRAEAGDVANAILDGTDCVMLSGETANGQFPEAAVSVMDQIARTVEASDEYIRSLEERRNTIATNEDIADAIADASAQIADRIGAVALVVPTLRGNTAKLISRHRPRRKIIAATPSETVQRRLLLHWGVVPVKVEQESDSESMIQKAISAAIKEGFAKKADKVVVVAGIPLNSPLMTNSIRVHVIGNILGRGLNGFGGRCTGRIVKARTLEDAALALRKNGGEILLTHTLDESFIPILRVVDGVILEGVSEMPWEMVKIINPSIVYVSQVPQALDHFEEHITVTLDGYEKLIYEGALL